MSIHQNMVWEYGTSSQDTRQGGDFAQGWCSPVTSINEVNYILLISFSIRNHRLAKLELPVRLASEAGDLSWMEYEFI